MEVLIAIVTEDDAESYMTGPYSIIIIMQLVKLDNWSRFSG